MPEKLVKRTDGELEWKVGNTVPCWNKECSGTILIHRDPARCICNTCQRPLPNMESITKTIRMVRILVAGVALILIAWIAWLVNLMRH
jgi:hypothetical protein